MNDERLAKFMARAGVASRRESEKLIEAGRVSVNGKTVKTPAFNVSLHDKIEVDGKALKKPPLRMWLYHKPTGLVTTRSDEKGRETIYDKLPSALSQVSTVGRLDLNSEGLLLLTNDGELKRRLELPQTGWRRKYRVRAFGKYDEKSLEVLRKGVTVDGESFRPMEIEFDRSQKDNHWFTVGLREGKNREIRRAFEVIDLSVNRLLRVSYGPFQLGTMNKGEVVELRARALRTLLGGLLPEGSELADEALDLSEEGEEMKPAHKSAKPRSTQTLSKRQTPARSSPTRPSSAPQSERRTKPRSEARKPRRR